MIFFIDVAGILIDSELEQSRTGGRGVVFGNFDEMIIKKPFQGGMITPARPGWDLISILANDDLMMANNIRDFKVLLKAS